MSEAFDGWWGSPDRFAHGQDREMARDAWNAAIEAAAKTMESYMGTDGKHGSYPEIVGDVRTLAAEEK